MLMGITKKKNIIVLTLSMITCFILYQLYFFSTITSETDSMNKIITDLDIKDNILHLRSEADRLINDNGVIKGVFYHHMVKYRPDSNNKFKCLNSEQLILFEQVNDDYCDCEDGTDEPSTTACKTGSFFCDSQHPKKVVRKVPSGRVNDGICDCCDGSDEWLHEASKQLLSQSNSKHYRHYVTDKCPNIC